MSRHLGEFSRVLNMSWEEALELPEFLSGEPNKAQANSAGLSAGMRNHKSHSAPI
jgi:hypothetical protein